MQKIYYYDIFFRKGECNCLNGKLKHIDLLLIQGFLLIVPFLFGLFYEFTAYFAQIFLLIILLIILIKRKKIRIYLNISIASLLLITLGYLFTCFYAVDKGMAFLGFLKFTIPFTFAIILMQYKEKHINKIINVIPISGIIMIILSIIFKYIPFLPDAFFLPNGRIAGFFQYSNTFALFLLIGIIVLVNSTLKNVKKFVGTVVLLIGILATGSRIVFLLTILNFIIFIIKFKNFRKYLIGLIGISIIITTIYVIITNNFNTFGRFLTTSFNSSTFLGRLLYYKDAIPQILQNPFGLGYMGYSYIQPTIQTGVYSTVFIHSELLQIALDIGIIPMIVFIITILISLINKNKFNICKQILLTIALHILFDFDLQFICMFLILVITLNLSKGKRYIINANTKIFIPIIVILQIIYLYFGICTLMHYIGNDNIASKMYSAYTEANLNLMYDYSENNIEKANEIADKISKNNQNIAMVYKVKAIYNRENKKWKTMIKNKEKSIEINKYEISNYEEYILMLSEAINYYINNDNIEDAEHCINLVVELPSKIEKIQNSTSDIAYKLKDLPNFELSQDIQNYVSKMKGVLEND